MVIAAVRCGVRRLIRLLADDLVQPFAVKTWLVERLTPTAVRQRQLGRAADVVEGHALGPAYAARVAAVL